MSVTEVKKGRETHVRVRDGSRSRIRLNSSGSRGGWDSGGP